MFQGFAGLGDSLPVVFLVKNSSGTPVNLDSLPTFRVYGPDGFVSGQTGSAAFRESGLITNATNASPIVITSANHNLQTGDRVTISGVVGNTAANGTFTITRISSSTFSLSTTGSGAYSNGGTWNITGLYYVSLTISGAAGYEVGNTYEVLLEGALSSVAYADMASFGVS